MISSEAATIHYLAQENPSSIPIDYSFMHKALPAFQFSTFLTNNNIQNYQASFPFQDFSTQPSCISSNSTSDESEEHQHRIIDERKQRRMISNRESARRSRMRKLRHLDELWSQVLRLRTENHNLINKLNQVAESHEKVVEENMQLKEEASDLRRLLTDIQLSSSFDAFSELDEVPCNTADHLKAESSNQSTT
ncbi:Basic leucine zipper 43 [Capsicum baccatum]|uniref:Basic leucine zipper 43 n=1 Tax=Capsicum baccatum TaxID=33114 RepID=A0A2G2V2U6_CAPBA|nr:Basic leucine zipper 43 [Capsicum baccatum]